MRQLRTLAWYAQSSVSAFVVGVTPKCPLHQHESNKCESVGDLVKGELGLSTEVYTHAVFGTTDNHLVSLCFVAVPNLGAWIGIEQEPRSSRRLDSPSDMHLANREHVTSFILR